MTVAGGVFARGVQGTTNPWSGATPSSVGSPGSSASGRSVAGWAPAA